MKNKTITHYLLIQADPDVPNICIGGLAPNGHRITSIDYMAGTYVAETRHVDPAIRTIYDLPEVFCSYEVFRSVFTRDSEGRFVMAAREPA